jgi:hypothetical protein
MKRLAMTTAAETTPTETPEAIARALRRELAFENAETALSNALMACEKARRALASAKAAVEQARRSRVR